MREYKDINTEEKDNVILGFVALAVLGVLLIWIIYLITSWLYVSEDEKLYSDCLDEMSEPFRQANKNREFIDHYILPTEGMEWSCSKRLENGELALESKNRLEAGIAEYRTSQNQTKTPKLENDVGKTVEKAVPEKVVACGSKEITIKNGKMTKMVHGDGTIHTRHLNTNWNYDGESITHYAVKERILCSGARLLMSCLILMGVDIQKRKRFTLGIMLSI